MKYIAKPNTWFKEGTVVELVDDYRPQMNSGLFRGIRICTNPSSEGNHLMNVEYEDEEICGFDEFGVE